MQLVKASYYNKVEFRFDSIIHIASIIHHLLTIYKICGLDGDTRKKVGVLGRTRDIDKIVRW